MIVSFRPIELAYGHPQYRSNCGIHHLQWFIHYLIHANQTTTKAIPKIMSSWKKLEDKVRDLASVIWNRPVTPERISGVNFDAVIRISHEEFVLIEITEEHSLEKVRGDITKIQPVKMNYAVQGIFAKAYIVLTQEPTPGMLDLGRDSKINVISIDSLSKMAFDFQSYVTLRSKQAFGSAINPNTGEPDQHDYIPVSYTNETERKQYSTKDIAEKLEKGEKIILLGEYGTGKSRCTKETFSLLAGDAEFSGKFVFSINLRDHWGATTSIEIIAGHLKRMGLSNAIDRAMQLLSAGHIVLILDGFDEVGSQTFGANQFRRASIRKDALQGVRELIKDCTAGILVTGRPHYFNSNKEMYESLGISPKQHQTPYLKCASEFDVSQAQAYLRNIGVTTVVPLWLPRKPLMFLILAEIDRKEAERILASESGEVGFWGQFIDTVCEREAKIHTSIDPSSVRDVLANLARRTRLSERELGRLTPKDVNQAYEDATGAAPDESGQLMLSRLCTLGRIEPESPDRQFVDPYIVQLLFAENLVNDTSNRNFEILSESWRQALKEIGIYFLSQWIDLYAITPDVLSMVVKETSPKNTQALAELVAAIGLIESDPIDFSGVQIKDAEISILALGNTEIKGVEFKECIFDKISFESCKIDGESKFTISDSEISIATGLTSQNGLPPWVSGSKVESPQSASNAARIKSSNLPPSQKLLLSIIQKVFFQRGGGRKESSLYKGGFGQQFDRKIIDQILAILVNDGFVEKSKDNSGFIYNPKREFTSRMRAIKDQLSLSKDPLWHKVLSFETRKN